MGVWVHTWCVGVWVVFVCTYMVSVVGVWVCMCVCVCVSVCGWVCGCIRGGWVCGWSLCVHTW